MGYGELALGAMAARIGGGAALTSATTSQARLFGQAASRVDCVQCAANFAMRLQGMARSERLVF